MLGTKTPLIPLTTVAGLAPIYNKKELKIRGF